jgi:tRNA 5-methylaminomethyl-2-thiouridine biosynthesis bifunctional protein
MVPMLFPNTRITWDERGTPHSVAFDDQYFCKDNGYEEGIHVCCHGNSLRQRFLELDPAVKGTFTILETGFGTGLDFCCAWELWDRCAPSSWGLHFLSVELFPVSPEDIRRALGLWPSLSSYKTALLTQYQPSAGDIQKMSFSQGRVCLTVVFDDVVAGLRRIKEQGFAKQGADACFFDGFAPSKNPGMWSRQVFQGVAALSRPGTTFSTFTVAGAVRRGLEAEGFLVKKVPGHGKKKQILTGVFAGNR